MLIGGEWEDESGETRTTGVMFRYLEDKDGKEVGWQVLGSLPEPLVDTECLEYNDGILVIGGKKGYVDPRPEYTAKRVRRRRRKKKDGKWKNPDQ